MSWHSASSCYKYVRSTDRLRESLKEPILKSFVSKLKGADLIIYYRLKLTDPYLEEISMISRYRNVAGLIVACRTSGAR